MTRRTGMMLAASVAAVVVALAGGPQILESANANFIINPYRHGGGGGGPEDYLTDLAHRWTFDTDLTDSVGSADGTAIGGAAASGGVLVLDGDGDHVSVVDSVLMGKTNVTVMMWFKAGAPSRDEDLFACDEHAAGECILWVDNATTDTLTFLLTDDNGSSSGSQLGTDPVTRNGSTWYHAALTYSTITKSIASYLNGQVQETSGSVNYDGGLDQDDTPSGLLYWGGNPAGTLDFMGSIDDIRIYDAALTASQIEQIYDATVGDHP